MTDRRADWLARLERWTEWPLTILALALIPILLAPWALNLSSETEERLAGLDYLIWGVFAADLTIKVAIAPQRLIYLRRHWIDVALVALPMLRPLRLLRSVRALQALRAIRVAVTLARFLSGGRRLLVGHGLHYALAVALVVIVVAGSLVTAVERSHDETTISDLPDGLWWAITTVTTVGYGDTYPKTDVGRGIGVALMLFGISLFGVITANIAAYFVGGREDELLREIKELRKELHNRFAEGQG